MDGKLHARILPPSKTFTGIALEGAVEASGSDFEALYNLYRLAYDDRIDEPDQLQELVRTLGRPCVRYWRRPTPTPPTRWSCWRGWWRAATST